MDELAIKIEHVSKQYRLGTIGGGTLQEDLQSWWALKHGKEDPNSKIGSNKHLKRGERFLALDDINLEVKKGEALGIIGHNGAGKSTLLKLLSRVTAPTEGTISYNGRITSMLEVGTGFHRELTGRENIYMNGAILGMTRKETDAKIEQIIDFSEVREFIDTPVKRYSSGMYVKLAFSVAAHLDSEIMIMDEVLAVGDMAFQKKCLTKMREAAKVEGRTVLYVSHNMNTIRTLCDRCVVLDKGKIIFDGDVEDAIELYMNAGLKANISNDYGTERNKQYNLSGELLIKRAVILNKKTPLFLVGEHIELQLEYFSKTLFSNLAVRFSVFSCQGTLIGMASSKPIIGAKPGLNKVSVDVLFDNLAPGSYSTKIVFFQVNSFGNTKNVEVVDNAFSFEVMQREENNSVLWKRQYWGDIMFPEIHVSELWQEGS